MSNTLLSTLDTYKKALSAALSDENSSNTKLNNDALMQAEASFLEKAKQEGIDNVDLSFPQGISVNTAFKNAQNFQPKIEALEKSKRLHDKMSFRSNLYIVLGMSILLAGVLSLAVSTGGVGLLALLAAHATSMLVYGAVGLMPIVAAVIIKIGIHYNVKSKISDCREFCESNSNSMKRNGDSQNHSENQASNSSSEKPLTSSALFVRERQNVNISTSATPNTSPRESRNNI